ncbi:MAG: malto-oligosyltrehalose trehalohydrolase [Chlamydiales bacterium]|nr:malto-oligosyltrehalose trehalohydrolase [Chlamydiales bacterium]
MKLDLGATLHTDNNALFKVWAPLQPTLRLKHNKNIYMMEKDEKGYFHYCLDNVYENDYYSYIFQNNIERADPVSRYLPDGPFGMSCILNPSSFKWNDEKWKKPKKNDLIFYECHVGTFTKKGTFTETISKLNYLKELGITCLEVMPITEFSGKWGWGYDSVSLFAPHHHYGTPSELKNLINCCHEVGIAFCLDIVYNHFGPEGFFLNEFGPYLTNRYQTPWGEAVNFDGPYSDEVKHLIIQNALYWVHEFHVDALRLDALHGIYDNSAHRLLDQLRESVGDDAYLIGESDLNDNRLLLQHKLDALWNDDFHHALHVTLTSEQQGYYQDFQGIKDLKTILQEGVVYGDKYSSFRRRHHGNSFKDIPHNNLIAFSQNHDQIGNRALGDRLKVPLEVQKVVAFFVILGPFLPLIFMGEEYGEKNPFQYFVDCQNKDLFQQIYEGRKKEFQMQGTYAPDIQAFLKSKLSWEINHDLFTIYQTLIALRKQYLLHEFHLDPIQSEYSLFWHYGNSVHLFCCFQEKPCSITAKAQNILFQTGSISTQENTISFKGPSAILYT